MADINQNRKWKKEDGITKEIEYLRRMNNFQIFDKNGRKGFSICTKNGVIEYSEDAKIIFHNIMEDEDGEIKHLKYRIVDDSLIWRGEDGTDNELIEFLLRNYGFIIDPDNFDEMYKIRINGKYYSYPEGTNIAFSKIRRNSEDKIESLDFHIIVYKEIAIMADDEKTEEIQLLKKKYGLIYDNDAQEYVLAIKDKIRRYPEGIRFLFRCRRYNKDGVLYSVKFTPQHLVWSQFRFPD